MASPNHRRINPSLLQIILGCLIPLTHALTAADEGPPSFDETRLLFEAHCIECHGADKAKSGIRFDTLDPSSLSRTGLENLEFARDALNHEEMPPDDAAAPLDAAGRERLVAWIEHTLSQAASSKRSSDLQPRLRRLTKREYDHSLQELFQSPSGFAGLLPPDPISGHGYDTAHELLMISQVDLKIYLETARLALDKFIHFGEPGGGKERFFVEIEDIYHYCRFRGEDKAKLLAPEPIDGARFEAMRNAHFSGPIRYRDRKYGPLPLGHISHGVVPGVDEGIGFERLNSQYLLVRTRQRAGEVVVRVHAAATQAADGSYPRLRLEAGRRNVQNVKVINAGERDVTDPLDKPGTYEFRFRMEDALQVAIGSEEDQKLEHLFLSLSNVARHEKGILAASTTGQEDLSLWNGKAPKALLSQAQSAAQQTEKAMAAWEADQVHFLHLDALEVEILPTRNDPDHPWNLEPPQSPEDETRIATDTLQRFLPQAFRRPLVDGELDRFMGLFLDERAANIGFETALKDALTAALVSPSFLYIGKSVEGLEHADSLAFASKLSYFLWASPPDEQLVSLAAAGALRNPEALEKEINRLLDDPRSKRLSRTFAEQWLALDRLDDIQFDYEEYPEYGAELAELTRRQTVETFQWVFHSDTDAHQLFRSDFMLLNDLLARHYGLPPVNGGDLRPVTTSSTKNPGGILTHASILAFNSDGKQSHPVKRGAWLLEKILNDPPPPPPPAVPDLDPNSSDTKQLSLKERIALHREANGCTNCHEKIDPWGVAFEEFDATGRWRDPKSAPYPIDSSTRLPDGTSIAGAGDLADYLLKDREEALMMSLVSNLMTYAAGREPDILDEGELGRTFDTFQNSGYRLKALASAVARSRMFDEAFNSSKPINPPQSDEKKNTDH